jgi:DNA modification methylase
MSERLVQNGDARDLLQLGFAADSVDCFITSPPYFNLKRYNAEAPEELGQGQDIEDYLADLRTILADCFALAKPTGVLWLIADTLRPPAKEGGLGELVPLPFRIADVAREAGWRLQEVVIWKKNKTLPYSGQGKLRNLLEYVVLFTKGQEFKHRPFRLAEPHGSQAEWLSGWPERYHPLGRRPANIWKIPIPTQGMWAHSERLHFCPLPQELVARCIELTTDKEDLVLDPFSGIGTVPAQAEAMGRRGRGVELNPAFIEVFEGQILPQFQAAWESEADKRAMARRDQVREAEAILLLRCLKAGKELSKVLEQWSHARPQDTLPGAVESVAVRAPSDLAPYIDAVAGSTDRVPVGLELIIDGAGERDEHLIAEIAEKLTQPPFSTLGLELKTSTVSRAAFIAGIGSTTVFEFEQSRRASFTQAIDVDPARPLPRLITTTPMMRIVQGDRHSPLETVRKEAERRLLVTELAQAGNTEDLAIRLELPEAQVRALLIEHGIGAEEQTFGIPLKLGGAEPSVSGASGPS